MDLKKLALAAAAGTALLASAPAFSEPRDWARGDDYEWRSRHSHRQHHRHHQHRHTTARVYHPPQQVVIVPPAPVYYAPPPRPSISGQIPIGRDRNINIEFQL